MSDTGLDRVSHVILGVDDLPGHSPSTGTCSG
jgi:hypothetical protein